MAGPAAVTIGRRTFPVVPEVLDPDRAAVLAGYEARNAWMRPVVRRVLSNLSGLDYDGSDAARRELVARLPLVNFGRHVEGGACAAVCQRRPASCRGVGQSVMVTTPLGASRSSTVRSAARSICTRGSAGMPSSL